MRRQLAGPPGRWQSLLGESWALSLRKNSEDGSADSLGIKALEHLKESGHGAGARPSRPPAGACQSSSGQGCSLLCLQVPEAD